MSPALTASAVFGALCAPVGIVVGAYIGLTATGDGYQLFFLPAGLGAFVTALGFWWLMVERGARHTLMRGALAGASAGVVAHYVCWYLLLLGNFARAAMAGETLGGNAGAIDPLNALWGAAAFTFWSLIIFGWLTLPAGALLGAGYAKWRRRRLGSPTTRG